MRYLSVSSPGLVLAVGACLAVAGCAGGPPETSAPAIPVTVSYAVEREVTDYADFTGRTAAVDSVEVRARVWGYLDKVNFKEGMPVKKGAQIAPAKGKLGVMLVGLGAVSTTFIAGVEAVKEGLAEPIGSLLFICELAVIAKQHLRRVSHFQGNARRIVTLRESISSVAVP